MSSAVATLAGFLFVGIAVTVLILGGDDDTGFRDGAVPPSEFHAVEPASPGSFIIRDGRMTANIGEWRLPRVAHAITEQTGLVIEISEKLQQSRLSFQAGNEPVESAMRRLFAGYDALFLYEGGQSSNPAQLRSIWIYPKGKGKELASIRPKRPADVPDPERRVLDADPAARIEAYRGLILRDGQEALPHVLAAMVDREDTVRYRTLDFALKAGVIPPLDALKRFAVDDSSEIVRFLALDGLATHFKQSHPGDLVGIAEKLVADPNPSVQGQARDILAGMHARLPLSTGGGRKLPPLP